MKYIHIPAPFLLALSKIASNLEQVINEMGWLPPSLTASRCAKFVVLQTTSGKDGNHGYGYDDWRGSG
ncbi:hypothetical protein, partial [Sphingopyxis alaskensis]|uniref:hypothetical protein n=1 Tax=Sphingopyxis alaskensis TaxID=117207 RepID=UPI00203C7956